MGRDWFRGRGILFHCLWIMVLGVTIGGVTGCKKYGATVVPREELFTITFGKMEDQLDAFYLAESPTHSQPALWVHDGRFYIANGASAKVMVFSSYGDLLSLYYNPDRNPPPLHVLGEKGAVVSNRKLVPYAFHRIGKIAVSSKGYVYITDNLPEERGVFEKDLGVLLQTIVLRFEQGEYKGYLGQEGVGGIPFPYIEGLQVTRKEDVVITCRTPTLWKIYWYAPDGTLKHNLTFSLEDLPPSPEEKSYPNLDAILPSPESNTLFFKISYFKEGIDSQTNIRYGIEHQGTKVFSYSVPGGGFKELFKVPDNPRSVRGKGGSEPLEIPFTYELLGILPGERFLFLSAQGNDTYQLLILQDNGKVLLRRTLRVEDSQLLYSTFHLSAEGILSALLVSDVGAKVVWWRIDQLLKE